MIYSYLKKCYKFIFNFYLFKIFTLYFCYFIDNFFFSYFGPIYKNSWLSGIFIQGTPSNKIIKESVNMKESIGDSLNNMELFLFFNRASWAFLAGLNPWIGGRFLIPKVQFSLLTPFSKNEDKKDLFFSKSLKKKRIYTYHLIFLQKFLYIKFLMIFCLFFFFNFIICLLVLNIFSLKFICIYLFFSFFIFNYLFLKFLKKIIIKDYKQYKIGLFLFTFKNYEFSTEFDFIPGVEFNKTEEDSIIKIYSNFRKDFKRRFSSNLTILNTENNSHNFENKSDFFQFWHYVLNNIQSLSLLNDFKKQKKKFFHLYNKTKKQKNITNNFLLNPDKDSEDENVFIERNQTNLDQKFQSQKLINTFFDYFYRRLEKKNFQNNYLYYTLTFLKKRSPYFYTINKSKKYLLNLSYFFFKNINFKSVNLNFYIFFSILNIIMAVKNKFIQNLFFIQDILLINSVITAKSISNFFYTKNLRDIKQQNYNDKQNEKLTLKLYKELLYYENNIGLLEKIYNNILTTQHYIIYLKYIKENPINIKRLNKELKNKYKFLQKNELSKNNLNSFFFGTKIINEIISQNIVFRNLYFLYLYKYIDTTPKLKEDKGINLNGIFDKVIQNEFKNKSILKESELFKTESLEIKLKKLDVKLINE